MSTLKSVRVKKSPTYREFSVKEKFFLKSLKNYIFMITILSRSKQNISEFENLPCSPVQLANTVERGNCNGTRVYIYV